MKTYTAISKTGEVLGTKLSKQEAVAIVRSEGGPEFATFKETQDAPKFCEPEQFTVREWAKTLRETGYLKP